MAHRSPSRGALQNGNVYYLGFFCKENAEIYYDLLRSRLSLSEPLDEEPEEVELGAHKLYLNFSNRSIPLCGYDLLKEADFTDLPPFGVVLV